MSPFVKKFKKEYSAELIKIAKGDLESAQVLAQSYKKGRLENIIYLCQQCVEKSLKAVLCFQEQSIPLSHDLDSLLVLIDQNTLPPHAHQLGVLSQYASIRRYEEGLEIIDIEQINSTLTMTNDVHTWAQSIIKK